MIAWGVGVVPLNVQAKLERDENLTLVIERLELTMQRHSKVLKWGAIGSLHQIRQSNVRKLASLYNTMIKK
jgi:hypothetical protein